MNCPNCQTLCGDSDRFCYLCGTPLRAEAEIPKPKKGSRWVPALILILMSAVGIVLFFATADRSEAKRGDFDSAEDGWFYVENGVLYFDAFSYTGGSELTVPSEVSGQTVSALSEDCFAFCTDLTCVILPDTLSSIGDGAFYGCTSLRGIYIPDHVNVIGEEAFYGCTDLEAVRIPGNLHLIREDAFDGCSYLGYIFYDGTHDQWTALYDEFINPYTGVFCADGSFYQGGDWND